MTLENEDTTLKEAVKLDGKALARIHAHLQKYAREWGKQHAEIEARRLLIRSIAHMRPEEVDTFKMLLLEMSQQA